MTHVNEVNEIMVRRNKVIAPKGETQLPNELLAAAMKNIESFGFSFSPELVSLLQKTEKEEFIAFYTHLVTLLKKSVGAHVEHKPMYANFPISVMEASEAELYINAILHYWLGFMPEEEKNERFPLWEKTKPRLLQPATMDDFYAIIKGLIGAKTSISTSDKEDLAWAVKNVDDVSLFLPDSIPMKENLSFTVSLLLQEEKAAVSDLSHLFKTATDVLRLAVALSDGDVSLALNTKFRKFKRAERRLILGLLESVNNPTEDMVKYEGQWKRLGEILHPGEMKGKFPKAYEAFDVIRNNKPFPTFDGKVEKALAERDVEGAVRLLSKRPGEFARRLDHLIRLAETPEMVVSAFKDVAKEVSTPVLLQVMTHFVHRNSENPIRVFFPKGNVSKATGIENNLPNIPQFVCDSVADTCKEALKEAFSALPPLGKVYIDPLLKDMNVPFSQRSASKALKTLVRGSKFDMEEGNIIRFFTWWKNCHDRRVDVDLAAVFFGEGFTYMGDITYYNLRNNAYRAWHSGDIVDAPKGAAEFIDIDIKSFTNHGGRYIMMQLLNFTGVPFCEMPECFAGWMMRNEPESGEIFEPKTVKNKVDIAANSTVGIPVILDLVERKVIWCDLSLTHSPQYHINVEGNLSGATIMGLSMMNLVKTTLFELFTLHAESRGELTGDITEAETIFSMESGITPFDIEKIMSEFM